MSDAVWSEVVAAARWIGRVAIAGYGEPFTDPRCVDRLRSLDLAGVEFAVATNGTRVTAALAARLGALCHLVEVNVSIDSGDADSYASLRHGDLSRALAGLAHLARSLPADRVLASVVLLSSNVHSLDRLPSLLRRIGVRRLFLAASHDYNEFALEHRLPAGWDVLRRVRRAGQSCGVAIELGNPVRTTAEAAGDAATLARYVVPDPWSSTPPSTRQCFVPWEAPFVDKDGRVFACCFSAARNDRPVGDLRESSLEQVWQDVPFARFRADLVEGGDATPTACRACTTVPIGEHLYGQWAAEVVDLSVERGGAAVLHVRNVGRATWTPADQVRVGTSRPMDSASALRTPSWLSDNRACTFIESDVRPGAIATFAFDVRPGAVGHVRLVVDGHCWLPGTEVRVECTREPKPPTGVFAGGRFERHPAVRG